MFWLFLLCLCSYDLFYCYLHTSQILLLLGNVQDIIIRCEIFLPVLTARFNWGLVWFGLVWFSLVLWHIKHGWLFNAKFSLYMYIRYIICKVNTTMDTATQV